ncbi:MAG: DUF47 family protein [bacterium]
MSKFSILKFLLPPEEKVFYGLFEQGSEICNSAANLFYDAVHNGYNEERLIEAKDLKHRAVKNAKETIAELNSTFITPIEREDIQFISSQLERMAKKIIKAFFNLRVYKFETHDETVRKQAETLVQATNELKILVAMLKSHGNIKEVSEVSNKIKEIETHGDEILQSALEELFSGKHDALTVIKLKDIYKQLENALDISCCVSDSILNVVYKLS